MAKYRLVRMVPEYYTGSAWSRSAAVAKVYDTAKEACERIEQEPNEDKARAMHIERVPSQDGSKQ